MDVKNLIQTSRNLQFIVKIIRKPGESLVIDSIPYEIGISAVFQVRYIVIVTSGRSSIFIMIRFTKKRKDDDLTYTIKFTCRRFGLGRTLKSDECDDNTWRLVAETSDFRYSEFDVVVHVDVALAAGSFSALHEDTELIDFELRGKDGSVHMHKAILAASSPVLKRMLGGTWRETTEGHVKVAGTSKTTLQHLKDYIYLRTLPDSGFEQLLLIATYYMMSDLEQICVNKLIGNLTAQNVCELLEFATKHKLASLMLGILEYVQVGVIKVNEMRGYMFQSREAQTNEKIKESAS